ncbi:MAG: DNA-directed RNA polymerase subunit beta [Planctomycetes bacterium]|nr:DNA-directed RNA polymerase subunit beta [Planctomycetota bacterium]
MAQTQVRHFGRAREAEGAPPVLRSLQVGSYAEFLQADTAPPKRKATGLESVIREMFPIVSYDGSLTLEYIRYELGKPRYSADECRDLRLTYGMPFKLRMRLNKPAPIEEEVYLGEIPIMVGTGEFIINGAERVVVAQLHRSPGVDFSQELHATGKRLYSCRIIPERGSWIEIEGTRKDSLVIRIDQSGKFAITSFLRAVSEKYSTNTDLLRLFYTPEKVRLEGLSASDLVGRVPVEPVANAETGEVIVDAGDILEADKAEAILAGKQKSLELLPKDADLLIVNTLAEDNTKDHEDALLRIYARLRPGNPSNLEKAKALFKERFVDENRYRLGQVGRFRLNRKLGLSEGASAMTLTDDDLVAAIRYLFRLREGTGEIDDIDHLGNRRLRTIGELAAEEFRKGFLKLRRSVQERMSLEDVDKMTPRTLINAKTVSSSIEYFFGRGELSQVVDQANPLAQLTHERRLSALGTGGLNRKRAGFEVRDVHTSHYGRICPIETPEGTNIGLITYLGTHATIDEHGFLITPYRKVRGGRVTDEIIHLRADEEEGKRLAPADVPTDDKGRIQGPAVLVRHNADFVFASAEEVDFADVSSKQLVGISAALIPFLEHDDANRALMGSNMQRQAVPLLKPERPLVSTGMEGPVAEHSAMVVIAKRAGTVTFIDSTLIVVTTSDEQEDRYPLIKFRGLNERTCLCHKPMVCEGDRVRKDQMLADGAATEGGQLALGRNVLAAFMPWDGYNYEDAIVISQRLVKEDVYTSIHIEEFEVEIRETKLGREEFTRDIPNVSERALRNLDEGGVVRVGTKVEPGDILVGKVSPKTKTELSPEEKLLHAIFGKAGEDVKDDSLVVPSGVQGIVVETKRFSRKAYLSEPEKRSNERKVRKVEVESFESIAKEVRKFVETLEKRLGGRMIHAQTGERITLKKMLTDEETCQWWERFDPLSLDFQDRSVRDEVWNLYVSYRNRVGEIEDERNRVVGHLKRGDELPTGVLEMVKVYMAVKRVLSVGDKMAGRHGNKGVIARIVPEEDMPFLEDGTPVDIVLNPLGVPSRMNVGQILETHLGWAARLLGFQAVVPVFSGMTEEELQSVMKEAGLPEDGKVVLYDGRTGETFDQRVTVGYIYIMKLHHLVDDKIHARATGPYSLITQQPLGGKARFGGQRYGEMEVWALEAYGASYILQEMMTVKSDDVEGRTRIYESMVKGTHTLEAGTPITFDVLTHEIKGLGLDMRLEKGPEKGKKG